MIKTPLFEPVPLTMTPEGVLRVGKTRVTLDTVIYTYREGATPEEIVLRYDTLDLVDVYAVIAYYLNHKEEVEAYLNKREEEARKIREENEVRFNLIGLRERLLARREKQGS